MSWLWQILLSQHLFTKNGEGSSQSIIGITELTLDEEDEELEGAADVNVADVTPTCGRLTDRLGCACRRVW